MNNKLEFNVVSVEQKSLQSQIIFEINRLSTVVRKTSVGQCIKSSQFELDFPTSIGKSQWILFIFPNGQYETGKPNDAINIYLKIVRCEHQSAELNFNVTLQFGDEYAKIIKNNQRVCFGKPKTRWICVKLMTIKEMNVHSNRFIRDDTLVLSILLEERRSQQCPSLVSSFDQNFMVKEEPYANTKRMSIDDSKFRQSFLTESTIGSYNIEKSQYSVNHVSSAEMAYNNYLEVNEEPLVNIGRTINDQPKRLSLPSSFSSVPYSNQQQFSSPPANGNYCSNGHTTVIFKCG